MKIMSPIDYNENSLISNYKMHVFDIMDTISQLYPLFKSRRIVIINNYC